MEPRVPEGEEFDAEAQTRLLFFEVGGEQFAIGVEAVEEIVVSRGYTPVPLAPPGVVGVVNHRGRIFTVMDFALLAGLEGGRKERTAVFLHHRELSVGITVSAIERIEWVPNRLIDGVEAPPGEHRPPFLRGLLDFKGDVANIIDSGRLIDAIAGLSGPGAESRPARGSERSTAYAS